MIGRMMKFPVPTPAAAGGRTVPDLALDLQGRDRGAGDAEWKNGACGARLERDTRGQDLRPVGVGRRPADQDDARSVSSGGTPSRPGAGRSLTSRCFHSGMFPTLSGGPSRPPRPRDRPIAPHRRDTAIPLRRARSNRPRSTGRFASSWVARQRPGPHLGSPAHPAPAAVRTGRAGSSRPGAIGPKPPVQADVGAGRDDVPVGHRGERAETSCHASRVPWSLKGACQPCQTRRPDRSRPPGRARSPSLRRGPGTRLGQRERCPRRPPVRRARRSPVRFQDEDGVGRFPSASDPPKT